MSNNGTSDQKEIIFPVSFVLKAIFDNSIPQDEHQTKLKSVLLKLKVSYKNFSSKLSSNEKYISISVGVKIDDRQTFDNLYIEINKIPGIKYAL